MINKYGKKCCRSDCKLVFDLFTMMLVEGSSEKVFLDIYLTTFFGVFNFGKTTAMGVTFLKICSKFSVDFIYAKKIWSKNFTSDTIKSVLFALNCLY